MANSSGRPELDDASLDTAEAQMRRALGDLEAQNNGNGRAGPEPGRSRLETRGQDRHGTDRPRARFIQDGDVPVTVLNRARPHEAELSQGGSNRLSAAESALAIERTARSRAERALSEAQALVHDLQTKAGHAELTRQELTGRLESERAAFEAERAQLQAATVALTEELAAEREARRTAEAASVRSERAPSRRPAAPPEADPKATADAPVAAKRAGSPGKRVGRPSRAGLADSNQPEPQPVKWWLTAPRKKS